MRSPLTLNAKPVDRRANIWAFGAVLFEMLTATRAFAPITLILNCNPDATK
ncbi:MAG TPA: hypothetical protein VNT81_23050 [Vicinamibacterales bacterium]|nr:hypothetical protein [Vicinamibacterales bacterium]